MANKLICIFIYQIKHLGQRPALIIHSSEDSQIPKENFRRIIEIAPDHVETWIRDGGLLIILNGDNFISPQADKEYVDRIIGFLTRHF